jgi:hypothetical protein
MEKEMLAMGFSTLCLVTVLVGLWETNAQFLRRMSACFAAMLLISLSGVLLRLVGLSEIKELADLGLSMISTLVLLIAGLEVIDNTNVSPNVRQFVGNSFPLAMVCYILLNPPADNALLTQLQVTDSASSIAACLFAGLALFARMVERREHILACATVLGFVAWGTPEMWYWNENTVTTELTMALGGVLVAVTATVAAYRRAI